MDEGFHLENFINGGENEQVVVREKKKKLPINNN